MTRFLLMVFWATLPMSVNASIVTGDLDQFEGYYTTVTINGKPVTSSRMGYSYIEVLRALDIHTMFADMSEVRFDTLAISVDNGIFGDYHEAIFSGCDLEEAHSLKCSYLGDVKSWNFSSQTWMVHHNFDAVTTIRKTGENQLSVQWDIRSGPFYWFESYAAELVKATCPW